VWRLPESIPAMAVFAQRFSSHDDHDHHDDFLALMSSVV
jgi:hypothetical protein